MAAQKERIEEQANRNSEFSPDICEVGSGHPPFQKPSSPTNPAKFKIKTDKLKYRPRLQVKAKGKEKCKTIQKSVGLYLPKKSSPGIPRQPRDWSIMRVNLMIARFGFYDIGLNGQFGWREWFILEYKVVGLKKVNFISRSEKIKLSVGGTPSTWRDLRRCLGICSYKARKVYSQGKEYKN